MIKQMLVSQNELQKQMKFCMGTGTAGAKENLLGLIAETVEALNELPWKPWKAGSKLNREALILELVDVLQFYCNVLNCLQITEADLKKAYEEKLAECYRRLANEQ